MHVANQSGQLGSFRLTHHVQFLLIRKDVSWLTSGVWVLYVHALQSVTWQREKQMASPWLIFILLNKQHVLHSRLQGPTRYNH